jgi:hypothetical protein
MRWRMKSNIARTVVTWRNARRRWKKNTRQKRGAKESEPKRVGVICFYLETVISAKIAAIE